MNTMVPMPSLAATVAPAQGCRGGSPRGRAADGGAEFDAVLSDALGHDDTAAAVDRRTEEQDGPSADAADTPSDDAPADSGDATADAAGVHLTDTTATVTGSAAATANVVPDATTGTTGLQGSDTGDAAAPVGGADASPTGAPTSATPTDAGPTTVDAGVPTSADDPAPTVEGATTAATAGTDGATNPRPTAGTPTTTTTPATDTLGGGDPVDDGVTAEAPDAVADAAGTSQDARTTAPSTDGAAADTTPSPTDGSTAPDGRTAPAGGDAPDPTATTTTQVRAEHAVASDTRAAAPATSAAAADASAEAAVAERTLRMTELIDAARATVRHRGPERLVLQLNPAELGSVTVDLAMDGHRINVSLRAEHVGAAQRIGAELDQLRQELAGAGVQVGDLDVDSGAGGRFARRDDVTAADRGATRRRPTLDTDATGPMRRRAGVTTLPTHGRFAVDL